MSQPTTFGELSFAALDQQLAAAPVTAENRLLVILDFIREPIDDLIDAVGIEAVIAQINALYDQYVAPLDIPWVPDVLEPTLIDSPAKLLVGSILRRLHDRIHKD